jgi:hypothetical protein
MNRSRQNVSLPGEIMPKGQERGREKKKKKQPKPPVAPPQPWRMPTK